MLGYVTIEKGELKVREYDVYNGYYCGICKSIGRRLGQTPRLALSYDSVFLALVLGGLCDKTDRIEMQHCIVHHLAKKPVALDDSAIDYAADVMVILAYHKFLDDWNDDRSAKGFAGKTAFALSYRKVRDIHPLICEKVEEGLLKLSRLEGETSGSLDETCDAFADIMEALFTGYDDEHQSEATKRILRLMGRQLGKWIYLVDAVDDLEEDIEKDRYNPLRFRYKDLSAEEIYERVEPILYNYLEEMASALDLLDIKKNKGIIDNIVFMGLRRRTENVLKKGTEENEQSI